MANVGLFYRNAVPTSAGLASLAVVVIGVRRGVNGILGCLQRTIEGLGFRV